MRGRHLGAWNRLQKSAVRRGVNKKGGGLIVGLRSVFPTIWSAGGHC